MYAHYDADGPRTTDDISLNKVVISVRGGKPQYGFSMLHTIGKQIARVKCLGDALDEKMHFHAAKR